MTSDRYSFKDTLKSNTGLSVYNTGYEQCDGNHSWGPALRDHYLIHFIESGSGVFVYNESTYSLEEGDLFLISPGRTAYYYANDADPWSYTWVGFNGTDARRLISLTAFSENSPVLHCQNTAETGRLLRNIAAVSGHSAAADTEMAGHLYLFLTCLIRQNEESDLGNTPHTYVSNALRYIQHNYANDIGVNDISDFVGISRSQLYRVFLQDLGISPHNYLQKYRINEACGLLREPSISIAQVAVSVGFNDPLYFSRVFKSLKGCSPSEYQKKEKA